MADASHPKTGASHKRVGSVVRGKYRVEAFLATGTMGNVYAATHRNGAKVALKVLHAQLAADPSLCERFKRVFLKAGGSVRLQPLNPHYGSLTLEAHRVLAIIRAVARVPAAAGAAGARPAAAERLAPPARMGKQAGEARPRSTRSEKSPCLAMTT